MSLLMALVGCSACGDADPCHLYAPTIRGRLCATCWRGAGRPFEPAPVSPEVVRETQQSTRERMQRRGGNARYLVTSGKS